VTISLVHYSAELMKVVKSFIKFAKGFIDFLFHRRFTDIYIINVLLNLCMCGKALRKIEEGKREREEGKSANYNRRRKKLLAKWCALKRECGKERKT
jgi:hypothetical protein